MLKVNFLGTSAVGDHVLRHFDDFGVGLVNPGNPALVEPDVCCRCRRHGQKITPNDHERQAVSPASLRACRRLGFSPAGLARDVVASASGGGSQ